MAPVYQFRSGFSCGVPASTVGKQIDRIRKRQKTKGVTPSEYVEAARAEDSPLHPTLEWDDMVAAHAHRIEQARGILRNIVVVREGAEGEKPGQIQAFVSIKTDERQEYVSTAQIVADDTLRERMLAEALNQLQAWRKRYAHLSELQELLAVVDAQIEDMKAGAK